ncbi:hypothetical protein PROFUN_08704 [Planoprotostelium fungivorum]|uniref:Uncharacterized protein n=1 Tax=Planoprotostelium fungivorum TaxID=1890364 RepID=A0A2P6MQV2_9EUKA|nr:hypothetical protein PROFUN_08704 [Planoprotostelium fungivorum]
MTLNRRGGPAHISVQTTPIKSDINAADEDAHIARQEKLNQVTRDFLDGRITSVAFRRALKDCGLQANGEIERMIKGHERDGLVTFNDMWRTMMAQLRGETNVEYQIQPLKNNSAWKGSKIFTSESDDQTDDRMNTPNHSSKATAASDIFFNSPDMQYGSPASRKIYHPLHQSSIVFNDDDLHRPEQLKKMHSAVNQYSPDSPFQMDWNTPISERATNSSDARYHQLERSAWIGGRASPGSLNYSITDIVPFKSKRHFERTEGIREEKSVVHPMAPFGTVGIFGFQNYHDRGQSRDTDYQINPHHYTTTKHSSPYRR